MRVAPYERLSRDKRGLSENVEIQREENREYAAEKGWTVVGEFSDNDISASKFAAKEGQRKKERPGYNALIKAIKAGEVDLVLVTEMPRLYRQIEELLDLIRLAESTPLKGIETTSGNGYDLSTGPGVHNAISAVNNAVLESRQISDRTKRKKKAQAKAGGYHGGKRPYGYEKDGITVVEAEAAVIREVFRRVLASESLKSIARDLNRRGVPTSTGKLWHSAQLRKTISTHRMKGVRIHNGVEYPAQWPAIIDPETWERLQLIFRAEDRLGRAKNHTGRSYLLTGTLQCGSCGGRLVGNPTGGVRNKNQKRYGCVTRDSRGVQVGCGKVARLAEPLERLVSAAVLDVLDSPQMGQMLASASENHEMRTLVEQYEGHKLKMNDLIEDYASGLLNRDQLAHAKSIVEAAMEETGRKMEQIQAGSVFGSLPPGTSIREVWEEHDDHWRRSLINMLIEKVVVHPGRSGRKTWTDPNSGDSWRFDHDLITIVWRGARNEESA
jgi:DNA invertase Pin-like site-specific DNA recombinase